MRSWLLVLACLCVPFLTQASLSSADEQVVTLLTDRLEIMIDDKGEDFRFVIIDAFEQVAQQRANTKPQLSAILIAVADRLRPYEVTEQSSCDTDQIHQLRCLINDHRAENGLSQLELDDALNDAAQTHTQRMSRTTTLDHTGQWESEPRDRCEDAGTSCDAENIAMHSQPIPTHFFAMRRNSPGHNKNMLGNHTKIGVAIVGDYSTTVFK